MESIPDAELSIWSYPGLSDGYLWVQVETTESTTLPWSNASFEWEGSAETVPLDKLEGGITVVAADSKDQVLYAGTANNGVHAAQIDILEAPIRQPWFYVVLGSILLTAVVLAAYVIRRFGPKLLEYAKPEGKAVPLAPTPDSPVELPRIDPDNPPTKAIRELLTAAFTPEDLRRFCQDRSAFRGIVDRFGPGHGLDDMVDEVVDYCGKNLLWDDLLAEVANEKPRQYVRFEPRLHGQDAPDTEA
jgi:hypothetical protein